MIHFLVQTNFPTVFVIGLMFFLLFTNRYFSTEQSFYFFIATVILLLLVVVEIIEYCTASLTHPSWLRIMASIIGYSLRPLLVSIILWMVIIRWWRNVLLILNRYN